MATSYSDIVAGTPVTWTSSGGDKVLNLSPSGTGIADGVAREGDKSASWVDATKGMPEWIEIRMEIKLAAAPTTGKQVELYIGESDSSTAGTANTAGLTGADAAVSNPSEKTGQLIFVGAISLSNAIGTTTQVSRFRYKPICPYSIPVVYNLSGQSLNNTGTNHKVVMTPYYRRTPVS